MCEYCGTGPLCVVCERGKPAPEVTIRNRFGCTVMTDSAAGRVTVKGVFTHAGAVLDAVLRGVPCVLTAKG